MIVTDNFRSSIQLTRDTKLHLKRLPDVFEPHLDYEAIIINLINTHPLVPEGLRTVPRGVPKKRKGVVSEKQEESSVDKPSED